MLIGSKTNSSGTGGIEVTGTLTGSTISVCGDGRGTFSTIACSPKSLTSPTPLIGAGLAATAAPRLETGF